MEPVGEPIHLSVLRLKPADIRVHSRDPEPFGKRKV